MSAIECAILSTFSAEVVAQIAHCDTVADRLDGGYIYPYVLGGELFHVIYAWRAVYVTTHLNTHISGFFCQY